MGSVPIRAGPDELKAFLAFHLDQGGVDWGREARIIQLDREVVALGIPGGLLPRGAQLDVEAKMRKCGPFSEGFSTRTSLALALRARVRIEPEKPLPLEVKVPMVAIVVSFPVFRAAPIAASMAGDRPGALDPHPEGAGTQ